MARPTTIRDETIVEAARQVFLARGIRATTAEVAEKAGVSEGSIFKRFKSKVELFAAAMRAEKNAEPPFVRLLNELAGKGNVRDNLVLLGSQVVEFFRAITPLMMMSWSNPGSDGLPCMMSESDPMPLRSLRAVAAFFDAEMRAGRLRQQDPQVLARAFLGAVHNFVVFEILFHASPQPPADEFVRGLVDLLWFGVEPSEESHA